MRDRDCFRPARTIGILCSNARGDRGEPMPNGRMLVVDDEENITAVIDEHFRSLGYDVDIAHHGAAALIQAAAVRPDVILLDVNLPEVSGDELLNRLLAIDPTVPVVMLTGNADEDLARSFLRRGAMDFVPKPFQLATLERIVATAVALGGQHRHRGRRGALGAGGSIAAAGGHPEQADERQRGARAAHRAAIPAEASTSASRPRTTRVRSSADIRPSTASRLRSRIACSSSTRAAPARVSSRM